MDYLFSNLRDRYERRELGKLHEIFGRAFRSYFLSKGYLFCESVPLISRDDKSVRFTSSSTNSLKPFLISRDYSGGIGFVVTQECLRNHALEHAFDNSWLPFGQAYFHISGTLSSPGRFLDVVKEAEEFTTTVLDRPRMEIKIKSTKRFEYLRNVHDFTSLEVEYDTMDSKCYEWVYGLPQIRGEGFTISIRNPRDSQFLDVGNVVRILGVNDEERGIEFAYGHEFLISRILGVRNPLALSQVFELFTFSPDLSSKYYGYIEAITRIKEAGVNQRNKGAGGIYRKYLRAIQYMGRFLGRDVNAVISEISEYYNHLFCRDFPEFSLEKKLLSRYSNEGASH